jgi:hypothetical protein
MSQDDPYRLAFGRERPGMRKLIIPVVGRNEDVQRARKRMSDQEPWRDPETGAPSNAAAEPGPMEVSGDQPQFDPDTAWSEATMRARAALRRRETHDDPVSSFLAMVMGGFGAPDLSPEERAQLAQTEAPQRENQGAHGKAKQQKSAPGGTGSALG